MSKVDPIVALSGQLQHVLTEISRRTNARGVQLSAALSRLVKPPNEHALERIAYVLAEVGSPFAIDPPKDGGIVRMLTVLVDESVDLAGALLRGVPEMYQQRAVFRELMEGEDHYPPAEGKRSRLLYAVKFPPNFSWIHALRWTASAGLQKANARSLFAVAYEHPCLPEELELLGPLKLLSLDTGRDNILAWEVFYPLGRRESVDLVRLDELSPSQCLTLFERKGENFNFYKD